MKKWLAAGMAVLLTTSVVGADSFGMAAPRPVQTEFAEQDTVMSLEEYLDRLSEKSGVRLLAVPEVAELKVAKQAQPTTLEAGLRWLQEQYGVQHKRLENGTILFFADAYRTGRPMVAGNFVGMAKMSINMQAGAPVVWDRLPVLENTEEYNRLKDNRFQNTDAKPFSTFSIDVDTASYSNIRRFVNMGQLPPAEAVRTEEMLNYFRYDYPQPAATEPFSVTLEKAVCPWQDGHQLVMVGLQGKQLPLQELPPANLVFLLDVSGSMSAPNKLPLLKTAFKMLTKQLRPQDQVAIVTYAGSAGVALPPTSGRDTEKILRAIDSLQAGGSTAGGAGLQMAYRLAKENFLPEGNNRVLLATDGDFNVGVRSEDDLTALIEEERDQGVALSVLGFGMGNIKDNRMEMLADKGNGNYAYIDNAIEAKRALGTQLAGTLYTIAKDVKVQVEFDPAQVRSYRLIGYENRALSTADFNNDRVDAGDLGAGQAVTALYEIVPVEAADEGIRSLSVNRQLPAVQVKVRYKLPGEENSQLFSRSLSGGQVLAPVSANMNFAAAVAEYGMLLKNSEFKGRSSYTDVLALAGAAGKDQDGYRSEFKRLVQVSQVLTEKE